MKKKRTRKQKIIARIVMLGTALVLVGLALFYASKGTIFFVKTILSPQEIMISVDFTYSDSIKNNLITCFNEYMSRTSLIDFDATDFTAHITDQFNMIKNIEWDFLESSVSKITIVGARPFCKVNDNLVLADNQTMFDTDFFRKENLDLLKRVYVASEMFDKKMSDDVYAFLRDISDHYWDTYDIAYAKEYDITLFPKEQGKNKVACIADRISFFDEDKILFVHKADSFATKHWIRHYLVDTRFQNRVIVRPINKKTFEEIKNKHRGMG